MPIFFNSLQSTGARIWIWHLLETEETLKKFIKPDLFLNIDQEYHHPNRRKQKIATRILLGHLGGKQDVILDYDQAGKPKTMDFPGSISISHSKNFVGLLYHPLIDCGLDIEEVDERVLRVGPRFINEKEKGWIDKVHEMRDTGLVWSIKESIFKNIGGGGILFKDQLFVDAPTISSTKIGEGNAYYDGKMGIKKFKYYYEYLEGVLLVHTIAID